MIKISILRAIFPRKSTKREKNQTINLQFLWVLNGNFLAVSDFFCRQYLPIRMGKILFLHSCLNLGQENCKNGKKHEAVSYSIIINGDKKGSYIGSKNYKLCLQSQFLVTIKVSIFWVNKMSILGAKIVISAAKTAI